MQIYRWNDGQWFRFFFCLCCFQFSFVFIPDAILLYLLIRNTFHPVFAPHHFAITPVEKVVNSRSKKSSRIASLLNITWKVDNSFNINSTEFFYLFQYLVRCSPISIRQIMAEAISLLMRSKQATDKIFPYAVNIYWISMVFDCGNMQQCQICMRCIIVYMNQVWCYSH